MSGLSQEAIDELMEGLPGWVYEDGKLVKEFKFKNFTQAVGWMMSCAIEIEKLGHHPEWINVYNRVLVALTTHDEGNHVTAKDIELAKKMNDVTGWMLMA